MYSLSGGVSLDAGDLARRAVDAASDMQASDILLLDLRALETFTDYFVIMSVESSRQMDAVRQDLDRKLAQAGGVLHHSEGDPFSGWTLMDYGDAVIHIFDQKQRDYFKLEQLWANARQIVRVQ
jgi:ribosome-associated protein